MNPRPFDLQSTYTHILENRATTFSGGPDFWAGRTAKTLADLSEEGGWLVGIYANPETWETWEMHPQGDELVQLLSGAIDLVMELPDGERVVSLRGREAIVVPQGVWHTAVVREPGETLHLTCGAGTQHRRA